MMAELKQVQKAHKEPESIAIVKNLTDMTAFLLSLDDKLWRYRSSKDFPLTYLICENWEPPAEDVDARRNYDTAEIDIVALTLTINALQHC